MVRYLSQISDYQKQVIAAEGLSPTAKREMLRQAVNAKREALRQFLANPTVQSLSAGEVPAGLGTSP
jgi:hypothetical protein